jgi:hypothetical protein
MGYYLMMLGLSAYDTTTGTYGRATAFALLFAFIDWADFILDMRLGFLLAAHGGSDRTWGGLLIAMSLVAQLFMLCSRSIRNRCKPDGKMAVYAVGEMLVFLIEDHTTLAAFVVVKDLYTGSIVDILNMTLTLLSALACTAMYARTYVLPKLVWGLQYRPTWWVERHTKSWLKYSLSIIEMVIEGIFAVLAFFIWCIPLGVVAWATYIGIYHIILENPADDGMVRTVKVIYGTFVGFILFLGGWGLTNLDDETIVSLDFSRD